jgi:hypothetical protein
MSGQVRAARLGFQSAAAAGDPRAARGLARTFDERVIAKLPAPDATPDPEQSQLWYMIADKLDARQLRRRANKPDDLR